MIDMPTRHGFAICDRLLSLYKLQSCVKSATRMRRALASVIASANAQSTASSRTWFDVCEFALQSKDGNA